MTKKEEIFDDIHSISCYVDKKKWECTLKPTSWFEGHENRESLFIVLSKLSNVFVKGLIQTDLDEPFASLPHSALFMTPTGIGFSCKLAETKEGKYDAIRVLKCKPIIDIINDIHKRKTFIETLEDLDL
ncbi:hypothetical protein LCGC14_2574980 [marine sediment metagenome]|uniref:Uncharacterized protein n=1 Tax=marine sediment metagenome TaxID=412755 RepID=A0A0F9CSB6_9ZZZZ